MTRFFVSIENNQFMRWQTRILQESLKQFGLEDRLVIAVAETRDRTTPRGNVVFHRNVRHDFGYHAVNRTFGLLECLKQGAIEPPFFVIDPDMFMWRQIPETPGISGQFVPYMTWKGVVEDQGFDLQKYGCRERDWVPIGCVSRFADVSIDLFEQVHDVLLALLADPHPLKHAKAYWQREMIAWSIVLSLRSEKVNLFTNYETPLDPRLRNKKQEGGFVHYCNGCYPYFDKRCHNRDNGFSLGEPLPFTAISRIPFRDRIINSFKELSKAVAAEGVD